MAVATAVLMLLVGVLVDCRDVSNYHMSPGEAFEPPGSAVSHGKCIPDTIPMCSDMPYLKYNNLTIMPNFLKHATLEEAGIEAQQFYPLVKVNCSPYMQLFLCVLYAPICTDLDFPVPPCRDLCEAARKGCENLVKKFGFQWPESLDCKQFPYQSSGKACVPREDSLVDEKSILLSPTSPGALSPKAEYEHAFRCPKQLEVSSKKGFEILVGGKTVEHCGLPCDDKGVFHTTAEVRILRTGVGCMAGLGALFSLFTIATVLMDGGRFQYPERPIFYLIIIQFVVCIIYSVGFWIGDEAACYRREEAEDPENQALDDRPLLITQSYAVSGCTLIALTLYYCFLAGAIWWVNLTVSWYLATAKQWGHEAIDEKSGYFHTAGWGLPAVGALTLLIFGRIDGDILTGVCFTGLWDPNALLGFVLGPLCICFFVGIAFLLVGFYNMHQIRTFLMDSKNSSPHVGLDKLRTRVIVCTLLYTAPTAAIIGCLLYERLHLDSWMITWQNIACKKYPHLVCPEQWPEYANWTSYPAPLFGVFVVKYIGILSVPFVSLVWIASKKTLLSWERRGRRCCGSYHEASQVMGEVSPRRV